MAPFSPITKTSLARRQNISEMAQTNFNDHRPQSDSTIDETNFAPSKKMIHICSTHTNTLNETCCRFNYIYTTCPQTLNRAETQATHMLYTIYKHKFESKTKSQTRPTLNNSTLRLNLHADNRLSNIIHNIHNNNTKL